MNSRRIAQARVRHSAGWERWTEEALDQQSALEPWSTEQLSDQGLERREKHRIVEAFPARVWAVDAAGFPFNLGCVLDNISSTGMYLRLSRQMKQEAEISLVVQLLSGPSTGTAVAIYGRVLRDEILSNGEHGIAVAIRKYKFL